MGTLKKSFNFEHVLIFPVWLADRLHNGELNKHETKAPNRPEPGVYTPGRVQPHNSTRDFSLAASPNMSAPWDPNFALNITP